MRNFVELTEETFETEVLKASLPVVVDFYAPWCGPCKMLAPLLEQLAAEFEGRLKFGKLNVDNAATLAGSYNVTGVPTLAVFRDGKLVDSMVGFPGPKAVKTWLESAASGKTPSPIVAPW